MTQINGKNKSYGFALFLIGCLFFIFGFITWSNSQLIPYLKIACELSDAASYLVTSAFFAAYLFMSLPSSAILKKTGYQKGMSLGLVIMAAGTALFIPAAHGRNYPLFLTGLFVIGTGLALLQTASNPYVTVLGPIESAASRISIMGICNKMAGICAVFVLGGIVLNNADEIKQKITVMSPDERVNELNALAERVIQPYLVMTVVLVALAVVFYFLPLPEIEEEKAEGLTTRDEKKSVFGYPYLWIGVVALFFYVGAEVISYDSFAGFGEALGYPLDEAKNFATYTGYCLLAGYVLSIILIPKFISQRTALIGASVLSMLFVAGAILLPPKYAVISFALLGLSNSPLWPAIWPLSLDKLGSHTKVAGALLVMSIVGGAVLTPLYAKFCEVTASYFTEQGYIPKQMGYLILFPAYLFILYFGLKGYRVGKK